MPEPRLPDGYRLEIEEQTIVRIRAVAADDTTAASGRSARHDGIFIYDQILTHSAHRRRGLGRAMMAALGAHARPGERQMLTATDDGYALYTDLGWSVVAPWSTAVIAG